MPSVASHFLPTIIGFIVLIPIYLRHRTKPVGILGWAIPLAAGLLVGLALAGNWFEIAITEAKEAASESRLKLAARTFDCVFGGLVSTVLIGALIPWLIPRAVERGRIRWGLELTIPIIGFVTSLLIWLRFMEHYEFSGLYYYGVVFLLAQGSLSIARLGASSVTWEHRFIAISSLGVSVFTWMILAKVSASVWLWQAVAHGSLEYHSRFFARALATQEVIQTTFYVVGVVFLVIALRAFVTRNVQIGPALPGWRLRTALAAGLVVLVAAPYVWLRTEYRQAAGFAAQQSAIQSNPFAFDPDLWLPQSNSPLSPEDVLTLRIGRNHTLVDSVEVAEPAQLTPVIRAAIRQKQRETELLGQIYEPVAALAVDVCGPAEKTHTVMRAAQELGVWQLKLLTINDKNNVVVINAVMQVEPKPTELENVDAPSDTPLTVTLRETGIDVFWQGEHLPPLQNCAVEGPTVCSSAPAQSCGEAKQDWERFKSTLVELKAKSPLETVMRVRVESDVPWQSVIGLIDAAAQRDSANWSQDGALFPDPVFVL